MLCVCYGMACLWRGPGPAEGRGVVRGALRPRDAEPGAALRRVAGAGRPAPRRN